MSKIRKGDEIVVLVGKDKGRRGVVRVRKDDGYLIVDGVNKVKKNVKPNPLKGTTGGVIEKEMPINVSNVAIFNQLTGKADRVSFKILEGGRKLRVFKSNGEVISVSEVK